MTERINLLGLEQEALRYKHVHMQSCPVDPDVLLALISELTELRALRSERSWIRCSERMPEIGRQIVALFIGDADHPIAGTVTPHWKFEGELTLDTASGEGYNMATVSHWMPLPAPPGDEHAHPVETSPPSEEARGTYACPRCGLGFPHTHPDCPKCGGATSGRPSIVEPCPSCKPTPPEAGK